MVNVLDSVEAASPVEAVEAVTREVGLALNANRISFLVADLSGRALVRLAHHRLRDNEGGGASIELARGERRAEEESATVLPFDGGPEEQAIRSQEVRVVGPDGPGAESRSFGRVARAGPGDRAWRGHRPPGADSPRRTADRVRRSQIARLAHLLAFVVIANRRHTDLFEWGQRTRPLTLSAEIQHRLLPGPQTCEAASFTLSGWLEPAAGIAGDTFDFSLARDVLHLSLTDAMGHGVGAALTATLCVGSLRNARNMGASLLDQVASTNAALTEHAAASGLEDFVTGLIGRVDLRTGEMEITNAGHVEPYLARGADVSAVDLPVDLPLGLFGDSAFRRSQLALEPGDRLVLVTDGMLERNAVDVDIAAQLRDTRSLHPREAVRALADRVLAATGHELSDDATVLCLDWHGEHGRERDSLHGAEQLRASRAGQPLNLPS